MRTFKYLALVACGLLCTPSLHGQDDAASALAKALQAKDAQAAIEACQELSRMGPAAEKAVGDLAKALNTPGSEELQRWAALALAAIGPDAKEAVPALIGTLQSKNAKVRAYSAHALGEIGPAASAAAVPLIDVITDKDAVVRREARDALRRIDAPDEVVLPHIAKILSTAEPGDAAAAVMTLAELGEAAVPGLCKALENEDTCYWAALTLGEIGAEAAGAVPHLGKLLDNPSPEVRMQAIMALGEIGEAAKSQVPAINKRLQEDKEDSVRFAAAYALGKIGDKSVGREALTAALDSDNAFLRVAGAWALLKLGTREPRLVRKSIQCILDGLSSDNADVRLAAAQSLVDTSLPEQVLGPAFRRAMENLETEHPERMMPIVETLAALGPKAVPGCIRSLENKRPLRFYALQVLMRIGPDAAPAVPALMATLDDDDATLRREALFALGSIGPGASGAVEKIVSKLSDDDADVAHAACYALGKIGAGAQAALPALAKQMESKDDFQQIACVWACLKISPDDAQLKEKAVPFMVKALSDEREVVRVEAAYTLGELGDAGKAAIPALEKALTDSSPAVQAAAKESLKALK